MVSFYRSYTILYWLALAIVSISYLVPFSSYLALNIIVTLKSGLGRSRSLKLHDTFESSDAVSYSPFIVTIALFFIVCEI